MRRWLWFTFCLWILPALHATEFELQHSPKDGKPDLRIHELQDGADGTLVRHLVTVDSEPSCPSRGGDVHKEVNTWIEDATRDDDSDGLEEFECGLSNNRVRRYLDLSVRTWHIDAGVLDELEGDLQTVVNCTQEGDTILFNVSEAIRVASRVTIPWELTLSADTGNTELDDGVFPRAQNKAGFRCPRRDEGVFLIQSRSVLLANLAFEDCVFSTQEDAVRGIVEVQECRSQPIRDRVRLHHVRFRDNQLFMAVGLLTNLPSCSAVEMIDVAYRRNECSGICGTSLSTDNNLEGIRIEGNTYTGEADAISAILYAPPASRTLAQRVSAVNNEGTVLLVEAGSLNISNSIFSENTGNITRSVEDNFGASIHLIQSSATIEDVTFQENRGNLGSAVFARDSSLTLVSCLLEDNTAIQGGAVYLRNVSTASFDDCTFASNNATEGGGVYALRSAVQIQQVSMHSNRATANGGAILAARNTTVMINASNFMSNFAREVGAGNSDGDIAGGAFACLFFSACTAVNTSFAENSATHGGVFSVRLSSYGNFTDCSFLRNTAEGGTGGVGLIENSEVLVDRSLLAQGRAEYGGLLRALNSTMSVYNSELREGYANNGGNIYVDSGSMCDLENVTLSFGEADYLGGSVSIDQSTMQIRNCTLDSNTANTFGGAVGAVRSHLVLENSLVRNNSAENLAGGVLSIGPGTVVMSNSSFAANTAANGAALMARNTSWTVIDCLFIRNSARGTGGAIVVEESTLSVSQCRFVENDAEQGGSLALTLSSQVNISDSICVNGISRQSGGCLQCQSSLLRIRNTIMRNNTATENGGAVSLTIFSATIIENSNFLSNRAFAEGGAVHASESELEINNVTFDYNVAAFAGGAISCLERGRVEAVDVDFTGNLAQSGGACNLFAEVTGVFNNVSFTRNSASVFGGVGSIQQASMDLVNGHFIDSSANFGGCFYLEQATLNMANSVFNDSSATFDGGFIYADQSRVVLSNASVTNSRAQSGGAVVLVSSSLQVAHLYVSNCHATLDGGAIFGIGISTVLCFACVMESNVAGGRGGAVSIESTETQLLAIQFDNSTFLNNSAEYGGGLHFVNSEHTANCARRGAQCTFVALTGTDFRRNRASIAGGIILATDLRSIRLDCSMRSMNQEGFYTRRQWESMNVIRSRNDSCPSWRSNTVGGYGNEFASYAALANVTIQSEEGSFREVGEDRFVMFDHASGSSLPTIRIVIVDELGQGPAIGVNNDTVSATMSASSDPKLFTGSIVLPLEDGAGNFTGIAGYQQPGTYELRIDFSEELLETFVVEVHVRNCTVGESAASNGTVCQSCNAATYNFFPQEESACQPCPDDATCEDVAIQPKRGHWHQFPCSERIQRCLTSRACDFDGREEGLAEITEGMQNCTFDEETIKQYMDAQCREGHTGPLCGSCEESYGKSQSFNCQECFTGFGNVVLLVLSVLILLGLSAFSVRSNLMSFLGALQNTLSEPSQSGQSSSRLYEDPVRVEMIEMRCSGRVPREDTNPQLSHQTNTTDRAAKEAELARWKSVELFKIAVNFVQITAVAISINVDWSVALVVLFEAAEFVGGVTSEAANRSVDCLVSDDHSIPRSVLSMLLDVLVPPIVICMFVLFWCARTFSGDREFHFFVKRSVLSAIAVFYISYISLTRTLVNILNCVEVHDSTDVQFDAMSDYWAVDTSLKCYEGSHAVLAGLVGWPFLVMFSLGFPVIMAYLIMKNVKENFKEGWIYDVAGFMYRAYDKKYVFWESVIMLRKAILAVVVVFAYPLGGNLQAACAIFVLAFASYFQTVCRPYCDEFAVLNEMEGVSLLVSLITFVSSLLYNDERVSEGVRILVTVIIFVCNVGLFFFFVVCFLIFSVNYLKVVLEIKEIPHDPEGNTIHIIKVYMTSYLGRIMRKGCGRIFRCFAGEEYPNSDP